MIEYKLPEILKQDGPECSTYAIAGVMNFTMFQRGNDRIDPLAYYNACKKGSGDGVQAITALQYGQLKGVPTKDGDIVFIKDFLRLVPNGWQLITALGKGPLLIEYLVPKGLTFDQAVKAPNYRLEPSLMSHYMVLVGYNDKTKEFKVANSWGPEFGIGGYFYIRFQDMKSPYLIEAYTLII